MILLSSGGIWTLEYIDACLFCINIPNAERTHD